MKNVMYKRLPGCYIMATPPVMTVWTFSRLTSSRETLPVPMKLKVGETAEIRCQLVRSGYYQPTTYQIRYLQPDGKGKLGRYGVPAQRPVPAGKRDLPALLHTGIDRPADD